MKQETFQKQVAIAFAALGQHMHEHDLPVPFDVDIDHVEQRIRIRVTDEAAQIAWLNTLAIDDEENEPYLGPIWVKTTWKVRLPDLGISFELRGFRRTPLAEAGPILALVTA